MKCNIKNNVKNKKGLIVILTLLSCSAPQELFANHPNPNYSPHDNARYHDQQPRNYPHPRRQYLPSRPYPVEPEINWFCPIFYVGLDGQYEHSNFKERFGKPLYNRNLFIAGFTLGLEINDFFAIETSLNVPTKTRNKNRRINEGQFFPGDAIPLENGSFEDYRTKLIVDALNFDAIGFVPLCALRLPKTRIFLAVGGTALRIVARQRLIGVNFIGADNVQPTTEAIEVSSPSFRNSKRRIVPHARIGIEQGIIDCIHLRLFFDWKKTTSLNLKGVRSVERPQSPPRLKFKDICSIGIGIYYRFL